MADLSPDQASFLLHASLLPHIISEHATTKAVVSVVPAERMTYRPDAISRNAFELAWHIVAAEIKYLRAAGSGVFPFAPTPRPDAVATPTDIAAWYSDSLRAFFVRTPGCLYGSSRETRPCRED